jgi:hypothetical protein
MPDWTGSAARADALAVPCRYCHAIQGAPCINAFIKGSPPLWHFAAHQSRTADALKANPPTHDDEVPF